MDKNPYAVSGALAQPQDEAPWDPEIQVGERTFRWLSWWRMLLYQTPTICALLLLVNRETIASALRSG